MKTKDILDKFVAENPAYKSLVFSAGDRTTNEELHPLLIFTQYIINSLISSGEKRIAIILPDEDCSILPLIAAECSSHILKAKTDDISEWKKLERGQKLRLGRAVIEFVEIDKQDRFVFIVGRTENEKTTIRGLNKEIYSYLEKCDGENTSYALWTNEKNRILEEATHNNSLLTEIRKKRDSLLSTVFLLTQKNNYHVLAEELFMNEYRLKDLLVLAELDLGSKSGFKIHTNGRLDVKPSLAISAKLGEIYDYIKKYGTDDISSVYVTEDKFNEVTSNTDLLKKCLKTNIPFIVFCSENSFEEIPLLTNLGFQLWHWKPSTMNSDAFLVDQPFPNKSKIFGSLTTKVNLASTATFRSVVSHCPELKANIELIHSISKSISENDSELRRILRQLWHIQKVFVSISVPLNIIEDSLANELSSLHDLWETIKRNYEGQLISDFINQVIINFETIIDKNIIQKNDQFMAYISENNYFANARVSIIVPDFLSDTIKATEFFERLMPMAQLNVQKISSFYALQREQLLCSDYLIVTWFDKNEYTRIKHSYCYGTIVFLMYDFENAWRHSLVSRIGQCIPHSAVKFSANKIKVEDSLVLDAPFDAANNDVKLPHSETEDYNYSSSILKSTLTHTASNRNSSEYTECVLFLLSNDKIAYYYPSHDVINVSSLLTGNMERPIKTEANDLTKGDYILNRSSGKDIIREQADVLLTKLNIYYLRSMAEKWFVLLSKYADGKKITEVCKDFNENGVSCTTQQVRTWLSGETICPRMDNVLKALAKFAAKDIRTAGESAAFQEEIPKIYNAGRKIQTIHQQSGRLISEKLKQKSIEIFLLSQTSSQSGYIDGVGDVQLYKIEEILGKELIHRSKLNKIEDVI